MLRGLFAVSEEAAEDAIDGHCEECAVALCDAVVSRLRGGCGGADALEAGTLDLSDALTSAGVDGQVATLFACRARSCDDDRRAQQAWWRPLLGDQLWPGSDPEAALCAGSASAGRILAAAAATAKLVALPLYVLCYIFDADELDESQLGQGTRAEANLESAAFSVHVVGLVLDGRTRTALLCDPNGPLSPSSGLEMLALPPARLPVGVAPTTSRSRRDRDGASPEQPAQQRKRARSAHTPPCAVCGRRRKISFDLVQCCEACHNALVDAEDAGGQWRAAYLTAGRLVECEGQAMVELMGHMLARPPPSGPQQLDGGLAASPANALRLLRAASRTLVLLGSGASAGYGVPTIDQLPRADPLTRYGVVRQAVLKIGEEEVGGLYRNLRRLLLEIDAQRSGGPSPDKLTAVVSTNIDDLAKRAGLDELQLHGSTGRLQCARCDQTWPSGQDWPPAGCPSCGQPPVFNVPTDTLKEEDVVWRWIRQDHQAALRFLEQAADAPLAVLAIGVATHVHTLTPELQLILEARAARGAASSVVWINQQGQGGALPGAMELIGDAAATVEGMVQSSRA